MSNVATTHTVVIQGAGPSVKILLPANATVKVVNGTRVTTLNSSANVKFAA